MQAALQVFYIAHGGVRLAGVARRAASRRRRCRVSRWSAATARGRPSASCSPSPGQWLAHRADARADWSRTWTRFVAWVERARDLARRAQGARELAVLDRHRRGRGGALLDPGLPRHGGVVRRLRRDRGPRLFRMAGRPAPRPARPRADARVPDSRPGTTMAAGENAKSAAAAPLCGDARTGRRPLERGRGGLSNQAWRRRGARARRGSCAWGRPGAERLGVDRASECALLRVVAAADCAAGARVATRRRRLLVTRFVDGAALARGRCATAEQLRGWRVHCAACTRCRCRQESPVSSYSRAGAAAGQGLPTAARRSASEIGRHSVFERVEGGGVPPALCHNDLHHLNLVDDGAPPVAGGLGIRRAWRPDLDLASFLAMHELAPARTEAASSRPMGAAAAVDRAPGDAARWAFDYVQWLWYRAAGSPAGRRPGWLAGRARSDCRVRGCLHCDNSRLTGTQG